MFQRLRDAIDTRIVEEQSRQRGARSPSRKISPDPKTFDDGEEEPPLAPEAAQDAPQGETEVRVRLRKLERLESRYQELLKAYRLAHARVQTIEPFETSLREHTPLTSISDPVAFIEYLNQTTVKADMVTEELKRVTEERNSLRTKPSGDGDFFSYDDEIPRLEAELEQQKTKVVAQNAELEEQKTKLQQRDTELEERAAQLEEKQSQILARDTQAATLNQKVADLEKSAGGDPQQLEALKQANDRIASETAYREKADAAQQLLREGAREQLAVQKALRKELESLQAQVKTEEIRRLEVEKLQTQLEDAAAQPSAKYFGFVNNDDFGLTGDLPEALKKFYGALRLTRPDLFEAMTAPEKKSKKKKKKKPNQPAKVTEMVDDESAPDLDRQLADQHVTIERLSARLKEQDALAEEIETLRDDLLHQGQEHVEAREALRKANANISELEATVEATQKDLAALEALASSRFKEVGDLRDALIKVQTELRKARTEVEELRVAKDSLQAKVTKLGNVERREEELRSHVKKLDKKLEDKDAESKSLRQKLADATKAKQKAQDDLSGTIRSLEDAQSGKEAALSSQRDASAALGALRTQTASLRKQKQDLEESMEKLQTKASKLEEELVLKSGLHDSSQGLVTGLREQMLELNTQAREAAARTESLEEEYGEAQRMLSERSREAETMRRLVAEAEGRTSSKMQELRNRMQTAIEERDRIEDEASTSHRRLARETESLKNREREHAKTVASLKEKSDGLESSLKNMQESRDQLEERSRADLEPLQAAIQQLREALDQRERESSELERQKADARRKLQDVNTQMAELRKANKELSEARPLPEPEAPTDYVYLKNVFLQFLEQKDKNNRKRLVPVLSNLLKFDAADEQKWMAAIS